jgi:hypothetical protein
MSDQNTQPQQAELPLDAFGEVDVTQAILNKWEDPAAQASELEEEATAPALEETEDEEQVLEEEELDEEDEEDSENDLEEEDEEPEEVTAAEVSDDTEVEIAIDGEVKTASIKDLKRLYGQEASLTRKSQEAAKQRKEASEAIDKSNVVLQSMLQRAQERAKPYEDVDMLVASKTMSDADFAALRKEAKAAQDEVKFLTQEADNFYRGLQQQQQTQLQEQARECIKVLQDDITDWSNNLYNDIRSYAVSQGLQQEQVDQYVDPAVIKILNKARLFDQGKKVATVKKQAPKKRVLKSDKAPLTASAKRSRKTKELEQRVAAGSTDSDDLAALILSRWET